MQTAVKRETMIAEIPNDEWGKATADLPTPEDFPHPQTWRVLLRPREPQEKKGSIILPDMAKDADKVHNCAYEVIELGPIAFCERATGIPWPGIEPLRPGDLVVTARYAGAQLTYNGIRYVIVNDDEILAKIDDLDGIRGLYG